MKFAKGDKVRISVPAHVDSSFHNAEGFVRCYEGSGVWVDVPTLGEHYANEARLTLVRPALKTGDRVRDVMFNRGATGVVIEVRDSVWPVRVKYDGQRGNAVYKFDEIEFIEEEVE